MNKALCLVLILIVSAIGQEPGQQFKYRVDNFRGGVNLAGDSTDLANNESLVLKNFVLTQNSIESRHGISIWNVNPIDTFEIDNIFIYEPYPDTMRLVIACGGFIYICPNLTDPGAAYNWDTLATTTRAGRLGFEGDSLRVQNGTSYIYDLNFPTWLYLKAARYDYIDILGTDYKINYLSDITDTSMILVDSYSGSDDTVSYFVYKTYKGIPAFRQNGTYLYIMDSEGQTLVYDDTTFWFLALVDSGQVTSAENVVDSLTFYSTGRVTITGGSDIVEGVQGAVFDSTHSGIVPGMVISIRYVIRQGLGYTWFSSTIIGVDSAHNTIQMEDVFPTEHSHHINWHHYKILNYVSKCNWDVDVAVADSGKDWFDFEYGTNWLLDFYCVGHDTGYIAATYIYCNRDSFFMIDTTSYRPAANDYYYIFAKVPHRYGFTDANYYKIFPYFEDIMFSNGQLFGFGSDDVFAPAGQYTGYKNIYRVFYSAKDMPYCIKVDYNFDLESTEDITCFFELMHSKYIGTKSSIYRFSGLAIPPNATGLSYKKVVSNLGIKDLDNWTPATLEYIYFADETGIYRFNGIRAEKISRRIDPVIDKYSQSETVLGYYDNKLYISWPDSDITIIYDEDFDAFYTFDFGMTCFNHQSADIDTTIFFFGHSDTLGHVFFYPNSVYYDSMPGTTMGINYEYRSGHQSHGDYSYPKKVNEITASVQSPGVMTFYIYNDFSATPADSFVTDSTGNFVYVPSFDRGLAFGEYVQYGIKANAGEKVVIRDYEVALQWLNRFTK